MKPIDADPIIKNLSAMKTQLGYDAIDIDGMIKALSETEEVGVAPPPNDPLTLKELQEMDGEPIYLKSLGEDFDDGWQIVAAVHKTRISCRQLYCSVLFFNQYGKTWLAYRRKPKEEK